jgi:SPP1 family predicted phage head-tail adaptor
MLTNLRHRVTFMKSSATIWTGGVSSATILTVSEEWANVQRVNMSNDSRNLKDQQMIFYKVTVRNAVIGTNNETINNKMYIIFNGKRLKINCASDPNNHGKYLKIDCEEETI